MTVSDGGNPSLSDTARVDIALNDLPDGLPEAPPPETAPEEDVPVGDDPGGEGESEPVDSGGDDPAPAPPDEEGPVQRSSEATAAASVVDSEGQPGKGDEGATGRLPVDFSTPQPAVSAPPPNDTLGVVAAAVDDTGGGGTPDTASDESETESAGDETADEAATVPASAPEAGYDFRPTPEGGVTGLTVRTAVDHVHQAPGNSGVGSHLPALKLSLQGIIQATAPPEPKWKQWLGTDDGEAEGIGLLSRPEFVRDLDQLRDEVNERRLFDNAVVGSTMAVTTGFSVGYVAWLARSGALLSSVLTSLPAWQFVDPLPVLSSATNRSRQGQDDVSLSSMVDATGDEEAENG